MTIIFPKKSMNGSSLVIQITSGSVTYNDLGYMTSDGTNSLTWDRAGRLLSFDGVDNEYNGLGQRVQQTVNSVVTEYLLDVQPGLAVVLSETAQSQTKRFVHGPHGIHAFQDNSGDWAWMLRDGLNSVRGQADAGYDGQDWGVDVQATQQYAPYGDPFGMEGTFGMDFGFTGEPTDDNDLVYLRARYLNPDLGVFPSLDPFEGVIQRAMSLNGYSYTESNPISFVDASGSQACPPGYMPDPVGSGGCVPISDFSSEPFQFVDREAICGLSYLTEIPERQMTFHGIFDLEIARQYAQCLLGDRTLTDLERLARLSDFVAGPREHPANSRDAYLYIMTEAILGISPQALAYVSAVLVDSCSGWGRDQHDCPSNTLWLEEVGFHQDYRDYHNQVYHFWVPVAAIAGSRTFIEDIGSEFMTYAGMQVFHEGLQGWLENWRLPLGDRGASWQDYALTDMGIRLAYGLYEGSVRPSEVGDWLRTHLSVPWPGGSVESLQYHFPLPGNFEPEWYRGESSERRNRLSAFQKGSQIDPMWHFASRGFCPMP